MGHSEAAEYKGWVEAFAHNQKIPIEWAKKGSRSLERRDHSKAAGLLDFRLGPKFSSNEMGLFHLTADKASQIFGFRFTKKLKGKL